MKKKSLLTRRFLLSAAIVISALLLVTQTVYARTFSKIVAFGDSLTDYGNLHQLVPAAPVVFSNGDVWVQYLAQDWGATLDNNAIAGAMTQYNVDLSGPYGLLGEINDYTTSMPSFDPDNTLFVVWIGSNDMLAFLNTDPNPADDAPTLISTAMGNISEGMSQLVAAGARYFLVLGLPDIGKAPRIVGNETESALVSTLAESYNQALQATINGLEEANPDVKIYYFDVFSYMDQIIASGVFPNTTGTYLILTENWGYTYNEDGSLKHHDNASDYMFWDSIHPMTATHKLLADKVSAYVDPEGQIDIKHSAACFIDTASGGTSLPSGTIPLALILLGIGLPFGVLYIRKQ